MTVSPRLQFWNGYNGKIAEEVIAALDAEGWPVGLSAPWGVDRVDVPVPSMYSIDSDSYSYYVNSIDTHIDGDYQHWFLVEVCENDRNATKHYMGPLRETWVTWLAVFTESGEAKRFAWYSPFRTAFFDRTTYPIADIRKWFVGLEW